MLAGISIIIVAKATPGNKLLGDIWSKHKWIVVILGLLGLLLFSGSVLIISIINAITHKSIKKSE